MTLKVENVRLVIIYLEKPVLIRRLLQDKLRRKYKISLNIFNSSLTSSMPISSDYVSIYLQIRCITLWYGLIGSQVVQPALQPTANLIPVLSSTHPQPTVSTSFDQKQTSLHSDMSPQKPKARSPPQQQPSRHSSRLAARSETKLSPKTSSKQEIIGKTVVDSSKRPRTTRQTSRKAPEAPKASKPTKRGKKAKSHISDVSEPRSIDNSVPDER
ncbi:hypothetical protein FRC20_002538 [Serendipita sp. 405]|nr:hypothetical protein FRC15_003366 [Serendipita sp. 397]KAG8848484.1 hypothetical protein FRC20_002538 [Serendipita sp. 405]